MTCAAFDHLAALEFGVGKGQVDRATGTGAGSDWLVVTGEVNSRATIETGRSNGPGGSLTTMPSGVSVAFPDSGN